MGVQIIGGSTLNLPPRKTFAILAAAALALRAQSCPEYTTIETGDFGIHKVMPLGEIFRLKKHSFRSAFMQYQNNAFKQRANCINKASRKHYRGKKPLRKQV